MGRLYCGIHAVGIVRRHGTEQQFQEVPIGAEWFVGEFELQYDRGFFDYCDVTTVLGL